ncbi:doubled CXXCH motif-containing protein [Desulfitobacterium dichloroeliminans LMG P-21439]|uniref:Doubled CXXCH motif-containing protein n=1 Tax=Desulfitobacterium dichloroeliminans (strain LMG P-21439 / DCA1) TaxID=871963 RepID=L0FAI6_DESDL|nr:cytochrome c3 family protein [Desulfitobacterium dichloroeliminans]AGA69958.1 doubled CXXCH motif-containing protein [Desulfitobacterium dichloroeliminans LMG P-21439]
MKSKKIILGLALIALVITVLVGCKTQNQTPPPTGTATDQPVKPPAEAQYVGSESCKGCHSEYHGNFAKSQHAKAFTPLTDYSLTQPAGEIKLFDPKATDKTGNLDLANKDLVYGVMMDHYVIAKAPEGFSEKVYRVAALEKSGEKYVIKPAKGTDVDKDGKPDYTAESFTCGNCHAPGIEVNSKDYGVSCESCHGPGGNHVSATTKKGTMDPKTAVNACNTCHESNPSKNKDGVWTANTHYGTRNYFASKHGQSTSMTCLTCHESHKANASGQLLKADKPQAICAQCHEGKSFDLDKMMWKNPTDARGHFTKDHSFGALPYDKLGDKPKTPEIEITNQEAIDLITKLLPDAAK